MKNPVLLIIAISSIVIVGVTLMFLIQSQPIENESKNYFTGEYKITENGIAIIDEQSFFVSKFCDGDCSDKTIQFHDVTLVIPSVLSTNPGGFETGIVKFSDGTSETLNLAKRDSILTVFTKHIHPQVGLTYYVNGTFNFLVSTK